MATTKTETVGRDVYVPTEGFIAQIDGVDVNFSPEPVHGGGTRVSEAWLAAHEELRHMFQPIRVQYDVEQATAAPGEKRGR